MGEIHVGQLRDGEVTVLGDLIDATRVPPFQPPVYPAAEDGKCSRCAEPYKENDPVVYVTITTLGKHQVVIHEDCAWPALGGQQ